MREAYARDERTVPLLLCSLYTMLTSKNCIPIESDMIW